VRKGVVVAEAHIHSLRGISGAEFANRRGFIRIMHVLPPTASYLPIQHTKLPAQSANRLVFVLSQSMNTDVSKALSSRDRTQLEDALAVVMAPYGAAASPTPLSNYERFGDLVTFDPDETKQLRTLKELIVRYVSQPAATPRSKITPTSAVAGWRSRGRCGARVPCWLTVAVGPRDGAAS
jgi:hypothetical protein